MPKTEIAYNVNLGSWIETVRFERDGEAVLTRYLRDVISFRPTVAQVKKIMAGTGKISIHADQVIGRF